MARGSRQKVSACKAAFAGNVSSELAQLAYVDAARVNDPAPTAFVPLMLAFANIFVDGAVQEVVKTTIGYFVVTMYQNATTPQDDTTGWQDVEAVSTAMILQIITEATGMFDKVPEIPESWKCDDAVFDKFKQNPGFLGKIYSPLFNELLNIINMVLLACGEDEDFCEELITKDGSEEQKVHVRDWFSNFRPIIKQVANLMTKLKKATETGAQEEKKAVSKKTTVGRVEQVLYAKPAGMEKVKTKYANEKTWEDYSVDEKVADLMKCNKGMSVETARNMVGQITAMGMGKSTRQVEHMSGLQLAALQENDQVEPHKLNRLCVEGSGKEVESNLEIFAPWYSRMQMLVGPDGAATVEGNNRMLAIGKMYAEDKVVYEDKDRNLPPYFSLHLLTMSSFEVVSRHPSEETLMLNEQRASEKRRVHTKAKLEAGWEFAEYPRKAFGLPFSPCQAQHQRVLKRGPPQDVTHGFFEKKGVPENLDQMVKNPDNKLMRARFFMALFLVNNLKEARDVTSKVNDALCKVYYLVSALCQLTETKTIEPVSHTLPLTISHTTTSSVVDTSGWQNEQKRFFDKLVDFLLKCSTVWARMIDNRYDLDGTDHPLTQTMCQTRFWACYVVLVEKDLFEANEVFLHNFAVWFFFSKHLEHKRGTDDERFLLRDERFMAAISDPKKHSSTDLIEPVSCPAPKAKTAKIPDESKVPKKRKKRAPSSPDDDKSGKTSKKVNGSKSNKRKADSASGSQEAVPARKSTKIIPLKPSASGKAPTIGGGEGSSLLTIGGGEGSSLLTIGGGEGSSLLTIGGGEGSSAPTIGGGEGSSLLTIGGGEGSSAPTIGGGEGSSLPTIGGGELGPLVVVVSLTIGGGEGSSAPTIGGGEGSSAPTTRAFVGGKGITFGPAPKPPTPSSSSDSEEEGGEMSSDLVPETD